MSDHFSFARFVSDVDSQAENIDIKELEGLISALCAAERPSSFRALFWLLLKTLQAGSSLAEDVSELWLPSESDIAQLLEDAGRHGTRAVLALEGGDGRLDRLWRLCDEAGFSGLTKSGDPWQAVSLAPMAALYAEKQLDELIDAVAAGRDWKDPAEILSRDGEVDYDLDALIGLAEARLIEDGGGEALNVVTLRLLGYADRVN